MLLLFFGGVAIAGAPVAGKTVFEITIKDNLFYPSELEVPRDTKVKLIISNEDKTPEEFESYELNREKIIMGGRKATIFIGPLAPGRYPFFGEFNPKTAQGAIVVR
jgi:hypothetical protein